MLIFGPTNFDPPQKQIHNQTYTIKNQKCTLEKMSIWSHLFIRHCTVYFFFIKFFIFVQPMGLKYFSVFFFQATESLLSCLPPTWPKFLHGEKILFGCVISILVYLHKIPEDKSEKKDFLFGILR